MLKKTLSPVTTGKLQQIGAHLGLQDGLIVNRRRPNLWTAALFGLWLLAMVALPIAKVIGGDAATVLAISINALAQTALVLALLGQAWGITRTVTTAVVVITLSWGLEFIGSTTGLPFGRYFYTDVLQPQVGHVPAIIPLAWLMMLPPAWAVAYLAGGRQLGWQFVLLSALTLTAWDLFIDPQMVGWGFWVWTQPGGYFGIPWLNFFGWVVSGVIITAIVRPKNIPLAGLAAIYGITWILQTLGQFFFWNMTGPALAGFAGMGLFVGLAWWSEQKGKL